MNTCHSLSLESKRTIICETPIHVANAKLTKLDTFNCDDINEDIPETKLMSIPEQFKLLSQELRGEELTLRWSLNTSNIQEQVTCDQVQLYKSDPINGQKSIFYTAPLNCQSENKTVLEAHFDLGKVGLHNIHPAVTSILACASVLKNNTILGKQKFKIFYQILCEIKILKYL